LVLWIWGEQQTRDLAAEAGVTKGTLTGVLKTLEKRGLARRRAHESDGRLVLVSLEPKGLGVIERLYPAFNQGEAFVSASLSEREKTQLASLLRTIIRSVEEGCRPARFVCYLPNEGRGARVPCRPGRTRLGACRCDAQGGCDEPVGAGGRLRLLGDRLREHPVRVLAVRLDLRPAADVQPQPELVAVDLGVELDPEVPAEAERLDAEVIAGEHAGLGGWQAPVVVELQPGPRRDQPGIRGVDRDPADLLAPRVLHSAAERGGQHLAAEADPQHGHPGRVGPAQPGQFLPDPGARLALVVHRAGRAEHDDVRQTAEVRQRALLGVQDGGQRGAARRERVPDEPRRVLFVMADDDDPHEVPPIAGDLVGCQTTCHGGGRRPARPRHVGTRGALRRVCPAAPRRAGPLARRGPAELGFLVRLWLLRYC